MNNILTKKRIIYCLAMLMIMEIVGIMIISKVNQNSYGVALKLKNVSEKQQESLVENTVKKQQELISNQIRQSLLNYINENDIQVVSNELEWNKEELVKVLNITVEPIKVFGNNGGMVVFDSKNGEVFLNTTDIKNTESNINKWGLSKEQLSEVMKIKDTAGDSGIILSDKSIDKPQNFKKFPLGKYDRLFVEKFILPFETISFAKDKRLTVLVVANEGDIFKKYIPGHEEIKDKVELIEKGTKASVIIAAILLLITLVMSTILLYNYKVRILKSRIK